jgi:hypothetical protein
MKKLIPFLIVFLVITACKQGGKTAENKVKPLFPSVVDKGDVRYEDYFAANTLRLDYYHSGNSKEEYFAYDQVVSDGKWPGSKTQLIDRLELGLYIFRVIDKNSGQLLYSRGFASIFGEWQTTPEADSVWGTFSESLRFPWPLKPVILLLEKRNAENKFEPIWSQEIDPSSRQVTNAEFSSVYRTDIIFEHGDPAQKVDLVILGDGYTAAEMSKFRADATRLTNALFSAEPFKSRKTDFNVRAVETPSLVSGVCKPHHNEYKRTPLSVHYSSFDSERYALSYDNHTIRNVASVVPYDFTIILVNEQTYGGGGIYNLYTTVSADNKFADYIMIHELGHHVAALADEYYTSSVAYEVPEIKIEPWETNITALFDKKNLKWKDLVEEGIPVPTPWNKDAFDKFGYEIQKERDSIRNAMLPESVMENLFVRQLSGEDAFFAKEQYKDKVGAFEGAGYTPKGLYRSQLDCIMYTRHIQFCKVCQRSLVNVFDQYVK